MLTEGSGRHPKQNFSEIRDPLHTRLAARLDGMRDLLGSHPRADLETIRVALREVRLLHQAAGIDHAVLTLVLHNMVRDLSGKGAQFEASYYAGQLAAVAGQLRGN